MRDLPCEDMWIEIKGKINEVAERHIPMSKPGDKPKRPSWMNDKALCKIREKNSAFKMYMESRDGKDYQKYATARNQAKWECRKAVRDMERKIAADSRQNPKAFFKYANSKLKTRTGIADLSCENDRVVRSDKEKAEALNEFFCSVFTKEDKDKMPEPLKKLSNQTLKEIHIKREEVEKKLSNLNPNKALGPDGISPSILKQCANELAAPLTILMNKSMEEGIIPSDWKLANVSPIFKKGKKTDPGNYRPVSLTSVVCKIMESIVRDHFIQHFQGSCLFSDHQHGFMNGRSCLTNLITVLDSWTTILEDGGSVDTIYLDFSKAFDTVPHERLLMKLESYGIEGQVLWWVRDFLTGRKQRVVVNGKESSWGEVLSGIPQGSVLGPFLFVCFVNDLPETVYSAISLFADDTKIFARVPNQSTILQDDLDKLQIWSNVWQLKFNAEKCKVMHYGKNKEQNKYKMNSHDKSITLETVQLEKDLGVNFDNELKFRQHITTQVDKANRLLGLLRRGFTALDCKSLSVLYKTIIRPHLEYGNVVWHPRYKGDEEKIESIQRRASKLISELKPLEYSERLKRLDIPTLYYRRARGDMIECFKYLNGIYNIKCELFMLDRNSKTRGHKLKQKNHPCSQQSDRTFSV